PAAAAARAGPAPPRPPADGATAAARPPAACQDRARPARRAAPGARSVRPYRRRGERGARAPPGLGGRRRGDPPEIRPQATRPPRADPLLIAEPAELPIPRGRAGPGMLADSIVRRWQDHQPLHRLQRIYARDGLTLSRSTLCGWHEQLADLASPLLEAMLADALRQPVLYTDATGVLVQAPERCRTGHFWVLVAPERHVLFRYSRRHDGAAVDALLP